MILRVAAYARVSTDKEDQINSLTNQREYFASYIKSNPDWDFAEVYYDEGVTGTQTKKRSGFNRMIEACKAGKIDLILTKEVSRFARNTVDTLEYTRMLKEYNVGVFFISDNIDTRANDGEFRLSIMASVAQEESRKISERVKWGQRRAMENGIVFGNSSIVGFDINNGILTINEKEAEVVRLIFHKYINEGKGTHIIARELYEMGIKPPKSSKDFWSSTMIMRILSNEKYVGDLLQKKYVTTDYLTHKKILNTAENKIYIKNHHRAIIDRDMWDRTQAEIKRRRADAGIKKKYSNRYWCSGKIICADCGKRFVIRKYKKKGGEYVTWVCHEKAMHGKAKTDKYGIRIGCDMHTVNNKALMTCMRFVSEQLDTDIENIADEIISEISVLTENTDINVKEIYQKLKAAEDKKLRMLDSYFAGEISEQEMKSLKSRYDDEIEKLESLTQPERQSITIDSNSNPAELKKIIMENAAYSDSVYGEITDKIIVFNDYILIRLKYIDFAFKIRYSAHGYKENYTTVIEQCDIVDCEDAGSV